MQVSITIIEPWFLGEATNWQPLHGQLIRLSNHEGGGRALIKLDKAVDTGDAQWAYLIGAPRHIGDQIEALRKGTSVMSTFMGITSQQAMLENPFDTAKGPGVLAFIGDLVSRDAP
jgi:hypothetical protein